MIQPLLCEQIFTLDCKSIKKIVVTGKCSLRISRMEGFSMGISSNNLISCKIDKSVLYIEPYSVYSWYCCCPLNIFNPKNSGNFSDNWKVNSIFIVSEIIVSGSASVFMEEGFDKTLRCVKSGKYGKVTLNKLYVTKLTCDVTGTGTIECTNSKCSDFTGVVANIGKIFTPTVQNNADCTAKDFGQIHCSLFDTCKITEKNDRFSKINKKYVPGSACV